MHALMSESGVDVGVTSQVIPIMIRDDARIFRIAEDLLHSGVYINPLRYPAVRKHMSRFRMSISASHQGGIEGGRRNHRLNSQEIRKCP